MTIEEIRKYAEEKKLNPKTINNIITQLSTNYENGIIGEFDSILICAEIDRIAEFWKHTQKVISKNREERKERRKRQE